MRHFRSIVFLLVYFSCSAQESHVFKTVLDNGLTVLVRPVKNSQKVSVQLWYNVGSKDEKDSQKGLAHLIEHMIFKGTKNLSESDIGMITHKLSGYCNAMTSYDFTMYLFNIPAQNYKTVFPIMADCMCNCTFDPAKLNSELKAVVQELKMRKDNYYLVLFEKAMTTLFSDHPYHYPVIGYKQDLWNLSHDELHAFYKKHYVPNNATLVVVGDVNEHEVVACAKECFESIPPHIEYKKEEFYTNKDLSTYVITLYRDIQRPQVALVYVIPGLKAQKDFALDIVGSVLTGGKSSRLHKKLVDELQLTRFIHSRYDSLFDHGIFIINFEPNSMADVDSIITYIQDELATIGVGNLQENELTREYKKFSSNFYDLMEDNYHQALAIGESYLATGNQNYIFQEYGNDFVSLRGDIESLVRQYFKPIQMHKGFILPYTQDCKQEWLALQERSDEEDKKILQGKVRESEVEQGTYVNMISVNELGDREFPKPQQAKLSNGIDVFYHHRDAIPKITLILDLKANGDYDSEDMPGLYRMVCFMLTEGGTKHYTAEQFAYELESHAMNVSVSPGTISLTLLAEDLPKGLELLSELLWNATFDEKALEKVRAWALADYKRFLDSQGEVGRQLVLKNLYPGHQKGKNLIGNEESIKKITRDNLVDFYNKYFSAYHARIAIVGDLRAYTIVDELEKAFGSWQAKPVDDITYPELPAVVPEKISYYFNRDQVILSFAGLSITRDHEDYDKFLIFNKIFSQGMNSRLFNLREKTGIFYTINGSLLHGSSDVPGMVYITTLVSKDRLYEAEELIRGIIAQGAQTITEQEVKQAIQMIVHDISDRYSTNASIASTLLFLAGYELPFDYFDTRAAQLRSISLDDIKKAVSRVLDLNAMKTFYIGRI